MNKYIKTVDAISDNFSITTTSDDEHFINFPAVVGNPNYDNFLVEVDLTDEEVHALPTDEWFEV